MRSILIASLVAPLAIAMMTFVTGCETKVVEEHPRADRPVVIDRPVVTEREHTPDIDVHVDR